MKMNLDKLLVQAVNNASGINIGNNLFNKAKCIGKTNQGWGSISGDGNVLPSCYNNVADPDLIDSYVTVAGKPAQSK